MNKVILWNILLTAQLRILLHEGMGWVQNLLIAASLRISHHISFRTANGMMMLEPGDLSHQMQHFDASDLIGLPMVLRRQSLHTHPAHLSLKHEEEVSIFHHPQMTI